MLEIVAQGSMSPVFFPVTDNRLCYYPNIQEKYKLKLLQMLEHGNLPHYYYADIMKWAKEACISGYNFKTIVSKRKTVIKHFRGRFPGLPECKVKRIQLETLRHEKRTTASVVVWEFDKQMQNLLFDHEIWGNLDNLNINNDESQHFDPYMHENCRGIYGEAITGAWYERTREKLIKDPKSQMMFPLELSCDRTHIGGSGRHGVCPATFTSPLIKSHVRNNPKAWRHLGLIPDIFKSSKAAAKKTAKTFSTKDVLFVIIIRVLRLLFNH